VIDALAIAPTASNASLSYARSAQRALRRLFARHGVPEGSAPPLLWYDAASTDGRPFRRVGD